jgi:hypothetical protein
MTKFFSYAHSKIANLVEAAYDCKPVNGLTHDFYRYPARFSPKFARAAIEAFTEVSDSEDSSRLPGVQIDFLEEIYPIFSMEVLVALIYTLSAT